MRLAFLGTISLMTVDEQGRPLHLGRKVRLASNDQWVAGSIWHRECVIPGCDRPATWCHAHHEKYWSKGGLTDIENLPFVCSKHHHWSTTRGGGSAGPTTARGSSSAPTAQSSTQSATRATTGDEPERPAEPPAPAG